MDLEIFGPQAIADFISEVDEFLPEGEHSSDPLPGHRWVEPPG